MARGATLSAYHRLSRSSYRSRPLVNASRWRTVPDKRSQLVGGNDHRNGALGSDCGFSDPRIRLHPMLQLALLRSRNIKRLNSIQESAFLSILSGKDVTIHAPIGSGKTLSYLLPIVNNIYNIHDLLENLQLKHGGRVSSENEDAIRLMSLGHTRAVPHALLPATFNDLKQDCDDLQEKGIKALQSTSTRDKLLSALQEVDPKQLRKICKDLPVISRSLWGRRSKNAIFRALMTNPLGTVRCCVIVVPNNDLVSHVMRELNAIDPLGRLSVQTLSKVSYPHEQADQRSLENHLTCEQPFYPSPHALQYLSGVPDTLQLSLEDEREMLRSVATVPVKEVTVKAVPVNKSHRKAVMLKTRSSIDAYKQMTKEMFSCDGFVPRSVEYVKRPVIDYPVVQYGSVDIVITTANLFLNDLLSTKKLNVVPACVIFDEVDFLFENNSTRRAAMEICSMLRPRPPAFNPLVHERKPRAREMPPCQFVHVASTMNYGGMQTAGSMIFERFNTTNFITSSRNHYIAGAKLLFLSVETSLEAKTKRLMEVLLENPFKKTVVYAESRSEVKSIYDLLKEMDWPVLSFHSRSSQSTRLALLETFNGEDITILVSTDLLARGLQVEADHIVNFSFPKNAATFLHRIKGNPQKVTNFITEPDERFAAEISKLYKLNIPVNCILSRKRSLRKRRNNTALGASRHRSQRKTKNPQRSRENVFEPPDEPESMMDDFSDSMGTPGYGDADAAFSESSNRDVLPSRDGYNIDHTEESAIYRRKSFKRRGLEFYNNFSGFS